jgi:hypothetical protein
LNAPIDDDLREKVRLSSIIVFLCYRCWRLCFFRYVTP